MTEINKNITLKTVMKIYKGFKMLLIKSLDDPFFCDENLDID